MVEDLRIFLIMRLQVLSNSNGPLTEDRIDRIVRKLALKSHLEARQAEDLRLDLAKHVRPSDGPFKSGDRVFFWDKDPSKIKDQGRWIRGYTLSQW